VLAFDVFGTVVDWRSGIIAELTAIARERNLAVDAGAVADAWRKRYQPFLDRVCRGEAPWQVLDELHRAGLDEVVREFALEQLSEADLDRLVLAWHHLPPLTSRGQPASPSTASCRPSSLRHTSPIHGPTSWCPRCSPFGPIKP